MLPKVLSEINYTFVICKHLIFIYTYTNLSIYMYVRFYIRKFDKKGKSYFAHHNYDQISKGNLLRSLISTQ